MIARGRREEHARDDDDDDDERVFGGGGGCACAPIDEENDAADAMRRTNDARDDADLDDAVEDG